MPLGQRFQNLFAGGPPLASKYNHGPSRHCARVRMIGTQN